MLKILRQKQRRQMNKRGLDTAFRKFFCLFCLAAGVLFIANGWSLLQTTVPIEEQAEIELVVIEESEPEKLSFEDFCKRNPISLCWDNTGTTDFLYNEGEEVAVIKAEEINPELLEKALSPRQEADNKILEQALSGSPEELQQISDMIEQKISVKIDSQNKNLYSQLDEINQKILDKLYEEELPNDVIDEEQQDNEFTHIYNKNIKDLKFIPAKKPYYFGEMPVIAVVIDDMGISPQRTKDISSLQAPLTASFLTYGKDLKQQVQNSLNAGQEIMIHVPMEAQKNIDTAPDVLTTQMAPQELEENLLTMLSKFEGVKGINNHMGSKFTEDEKRMEVIMKVLKAHNLFFLDSKTSAKSRAKEAAQRIEIAYAQRNVFLDNNNDKKYILGQLEQTERLAKKNGFAIAIGHPKTQTYAALKEWLPTLQDKKIKLTPLSEIVSVLNPNVFAK